MPELPEVEALARAIETHLAGRRIATLELGSLAALKTFEPPLHELEGRTIDRVWRRGKYLVLDAEGIDLVIHLSRAGWLRWRDDMPATPLRPGKGPMALRLTAVTADGEAAGGFEVTEAGTRKGLAIYVVSNVEDVPRGDSLGPEPLGADFPIEALQGILTSAGRAQIKGVLRDQSMIAGIGNAYSDEILHIARISPFAPADSVDASVLHDSIVTTLSAASSRALDADMASLKAEKRDGMRVHGRAGQACPECGDTIREVSFADRSLQYCPTCQTEGKILADRRMSRLLR